MSARKADPAATVGRLLEVWEQQFTAEVPDLDVVRAAADDAVAAAQSIGADQQAAGLAAVVASTLRTYTARLTPRVMMVSDDERGAARYQALGRIVALQVAVGAIVAPFEGRADLAAAESALAEALDRQAQATTDLEAAVTGGDVTSVMRLRGEAQVSLPKQVAEAESRALELRVAAAEALAPFVQQQHEQFVQRREDALQRFKQAEQALSHARADYYSALSMESESRDVTREAEREADHLRATLADHVQTSAAEHTRSLRSLAGLETEAAIA